MSDESSALGDTSVAGKKRSRLRGPGRPKRSVQYRDMYRVLDGSALVALGRSQDFPWEVTIAHPLPFRRPCSRVCS